MYKIYVRRAGEDGYGIVSKHGKELEFSTEEEAKTWAKENIEGKSKFVVSWYVGK
jgi:hypothetical protein